MLQLAYPEIAPVKQALLLSKSEQNMKGAPTCLTEVLSESSDTYLDLHSRACASVVNAVSVALCHQPLDKCCQAQAWLRLMQRKHVMLDPVFCTSASTHSQGKPHTTKVLVIRPNMACLCTLQSCQIEPSASVHQQADVA